MNRFTFKPKLLLDLKGYNREKFSADVLAGIIVGAVVAPNADKLFANGLLILSVVILHNLLGYALGYAVGKLLHMSDAKCNAVSIEVGMQNSGLATSLAGTVFPDLALATFPGALFSVWHNISGSIVSAAFLTVLPEVLRPINNYRMLIYAVVLILVMVVPNTKIYQRLADAVRSKLRREPKVPVAAAEGGEADE